MPKDWSGTSSNRCCLSRRDRDEDVSDGYSNESQRSEAAFAQQGWDSNPDLCKCNGGGWVLSNLDQWHRCPIHGAGLPHPEDEVLDAAEEELRGVKLGLEAGKSEPESNGVEEDSVPF